MVLDLAAYNKDNLANACTSRLPDLDPVGGQATRTSGADTPTSATPAASTSGSIVGSATY